MNEKNCEWCGKSLRGKRSDATVCSRKCYESRRSRRLTDERKRKRSKSCVQCGGPIPESRRSDAVTCSVECNSLRFKEIRSEKARARRSRKCKECGSELTKELKVLEEYCSDACRKAKKRRYDDEWRKRNPEKTSGYLKKWRESNLDVVANHRHKRRALMANAYVEKVQASKVYERDNWVCGICGDAIDRELLWPDSGCATIDHVVPLALGGTHEYANVQAAHFSCNSSKGARLIALDGTQVAGTGVSECESCML